MKRLILLVLIVLAACQPPVNKGWEATGYKRAGCTIHYKINRDRFTDDGRKAMGFDVSDQIIASANEMYSLTRVRWVFDGYTHATWDGRNGTRSGKAWATTNGVLIELHTHNWSQPNPEAGPKYTGGVIWYDMDSMYFIRQTQPWSVYYAAAKGIFRHEMGHQHGLGDLYDGKPHSWPSDIVRYNKMGTSNVPWGSGDKQGFAALRPAGC